MQASELKNLQAPLKDLYRQSPDQAIATLRASGTVNLAGLSCAVDVSHIDGSTVVSGLHAKAGGDGQAACSGDMLLQSLIACSGVTLAAVATAMELAVESVTIEAVGTMDFRGTLGVDRSTPIGLQTVELVFRIESAEPVEKLDKLVQLTERYCVVLQTISAGATTSCRRA
jgi:uncharacterized OsmC-like protein